MKTSMLDFARSGRLGLIEVGMTHDEVTARLGRPAGYTVADAIWLYAEIELHFDRDRVCLLYSDHGTLVASGGVLDIDPWVIRRGLSRAALEGALADNGIEFAIERRWRPAQSELVTVSGVIFSFLDELEQPGDVVGLQSWSKTVNA